MKSSQTRIKNLITESIALLCKNGLEFDEEIRVEGVVGITLDNKEVLLVHINEKYLDDKESGSSGSVNQHSDCAGVNVETQTRFASSTFSQKDASSNDISRLVPGLPIKNVPEAIKHVLPKRVSTSSSHVNNHSKSDVKVANNSLLNVPPTVKQEPIETEFNFENINVAEMHLDPSTVAAVKSQHPFCMNNATVNSMGPLDIAGFSGDNDSSAILIDDNDPEPNTSSAGENFRSPESYPLDSICWEDMSAVSNSYLSNRDLKKTEFGNFGMGVGVDWKAIKPVSIGYNRRRKKQSGTYRCPYGDCGKVFHHLPSLCRHKRIFHGYVSPHARHTSQHYKSLGHHQEMINDTSVKI